MDPRSATTEGRRGAFFEPPDEAGAAEIAKAATTAKMVSTRIMVVRPCGVG